MGIAQSAYPAANGQLPDICILQALKVSPSYFLGIDPFFSLYASPDSKNNKIMIATLSQGGLGLPDRYFYFRQDNASKRVERKA
ncbi:MAG: hypothetical protein ACE14P_05645 [Methanotrichaceae archaeon]